MQVVMCLSQLSASNARGVPSVGGRSALSPQDWPPLFATAQEISPGFYLEAVK